MAKINFIKYYLMSQATHKPGKIKSLIKYFPKSNPSQLASASSFIPNLKFNSYYQNEKKLVKTSKISK